MRITHWKVKGVFSAADIARFAVLSLVILVVADGSSQATAQEAVEAAPSAAVEQSAKEESAKEESAKDQSETTESANGDSPKAAEAVADSAKSDSAKSDSAKSDSAKSDSAKSDSAKSEEDIGDSTKTDSPNVDSTKVVPAGGDSANGDSAKVETVSFESVNSHSVAMTGLHNHYRTQAGLSAQSVDPQLTNVAQNWANHMASVGSMYHGGGEQIIAYSGGDLSYDAGFRLWLNSSPHRAWLYSRGDQCGFGYSIGRNGCAYFAGAFGSSYSGGDSVSGSYQTTSYNNGRRFRLFRRRS